MFIKYRTNFLSSSILLKQNLNFRTMQNAEYHRHANDDKRNPISLDLAFSLINCSRLHCTFLLSSHCTHSAGFFYNDSKTWAQFALLWDYLRYCGTSSKSYFHQSLTGAARCSQKHPHGLWYSWHPVFEG